MATRREEGGLFKRLRRWYYDTHIAPNNGKDVEVEEQYEENEATNSDNNFIQMETTPKSISTEEKSMNNFRKDIDDFLSRTEQYEKLGYENALNEPDTSNMKIYADRIKIEFERIVMEVLRQYKNEMFRNKDSNQIAEESQMKDTALRINTENEILQKEMDEIEAMLKDMKANTGIGYGLILAYEQGFKRALAAKLIGRI